MGYYIINHIQPKPKETNKKGLYQMLIFIFKSLNFKYNQFSNQ